MTNQLNNIYQQLHNNWIINDFQNNNSNIQFIPILLIGIVTVIISLGIIWLISYIFKKEIDTQYFILKFVITFIIVIIGIGVGIYNYSQHAINQIINQPKTEIKTNVYQQTVINYKTRFETTKWLYNANIVYTKNIGDNKITTNQKLKTQINQQTKQLNTIKTNLHKLRYLDDTFNFKQDYTAANQLYPNINSSNQTSIKATQLADTKLQKDIEQNINEK